MTDAVLTPITQALRDGKLTRRELKALMRRSDGPALVRLALWVVLLAFTGGLIAATMHTLWIWPAMLVHGVVLVHLFALQHECVHYTPFRTRWLNDVVGNLCGAVILLPHQHFRFEHCDHHTHTQVHGDDPELIPLPKSIWGYLWYLSAVPYWTNYLRQMLRHAAGRINPDEAVFLPKEVRQVIFWEARALLSLHFGLLAVCAVTGWWAPLWFWWLPVLLGQPVMRVIRMTSMWAAPPYAT